MSYTQNTSIESFKSQAEKIKNAPTYEDQLNQAEALLKQVQNASNNLPINDPLFIEYQKLKKSIEETRKEAAEKLLEDKSKVYRDTQSQLSTAEPNANPNPNTPVVTPTPVQSFDALKTTNVNVVTPPSKPNGIDDAAYQKEIQEFQAESKGKLREILSAESIEGWKNALEFVEKLAQMDVEKDKRFNFLDENEKKIFKQQLPAVQGMVGAVLLDELMERGYAIDVKENGTVTLASSVGNNIPFTESATLTLNEHIKKSPIIYQAIKSGLLYHSNDLVNFSRTVSDSKGKIDANNVTNQQFMNYLWAQKKDNQGTAVGDIMLKNPNLFSDQEIREYFVSVPHMSGMKQVLQAAIANPDIDKNIKNMAQDSLGATRSENASPQQAAAISDGNNRGGRGVKDIPSGAYPDYAESMAKHGFIGWSLEAGFLSYARTFSKLGEMGPGAMGGALLLFIGASMHFGFFKTLKYLFFGIPLATLVADLGEDGLKQLGLIEKEKTQVLSTNPEAAAGQIADNVGTLPPPTSEENNAITDSIHGTNNQTPEKREEINTVLLPINTAPMGEIDKALNNQQNNLSDEHKKYIEWLSQEQKEIVKQEIDWLRGQFDAQIADMGIYQNADESVKQTLPYLKDKLSPEYMRRILAATPTEAEQMILNQLQPFLKTEEEKNALTEIWNIIKENKFTAGMVAIIMLTGIPALRSGKGLVKSMIVVPWLLSMYENYKNNKTIILGRQKTPNTNSIQSIRDVGNSLRNKSPILKPDTFKVSPPDAKKSAKSRNERALEMHRENYTEYKQRLLDIKTEAQALKLWASRSKQAKIDAYIAQIDAKLHQVKLSSSYATSSKDVWQELDAHLAKDPATRWDTITVNGQTIDLSVQRAQVDVQVGGTTYGVKLTPEEVSKYNTLVSELKGLSGNNLDATNATKVNQKMDELSNLLKNADLSIPLPASGSTPARTKLEHIAPSYHIGKNAISKFNGRFKFNASDALSRIGVSAHL